MATSVIKSNQFKEVQFVDDQYNWLRVTKQGDVITVDYIRKEAVPNVTDAYTIDSTYAPSINLAALDFYQQTSGYSIVVATLKPTGVITLSATVYNEPVAGAFHWTYSK